MIWHNATPEEIIEELGTNLEKGLSKSQVESLTDEYGKNLAVSEEEISMTSAIISQLNKPPIILLAILMIIYVLREIVLNTNNFVLPIAAFLILAFKETLCIFSEYRSRNMLFMLKNRINTTAKVIRDGTEQVIDSDFLVPGDIIILNEGDFVPADARLIESFALRCDEAVLYGEKEVIMVPKDAILLFEDHAPVNERANMVYCGSHIMTGSAKAVVVGTGKDAEIHRSVIKDKVFAHKGIQDRIADRFSDFYKIFRASAFGGCALITLLITLLGASPITWGKFLEALIAANCLYIAIVPGSFPTRIACLISLGIKRFEKDKAVIFTPQTIEKLAGVTVICSDKTGTLTQNRMTLNTIYDGEKFIDLYSDNVTKQGEIALRFGTLSCDSNDHEIPDHTEAAIVSAASRYLNISKSDLDAEFPRTSCIPLSPERKIKTTVNMIEGKFFSIVRGAPDIILERCVNVDFEQITKAYEQMCSKGLRVLAISYCVLDDLPSEPTSEKLENNLQFLGLFGISDRERRGVSKDIELCKNAGISTVMFTGDHINTATAQAQNMGVLKNDDISVTGEQLDELTDDELAVIVNKIKVCARISPEGRTRIVNALHTNNQTVLLTADSAANFAPMAVADVGCAMGKTGTNVAIGNADVVVYDDKFSTIVKSISNARGIFGNFTKYINYYVALCGCVLFGLLLCLIFFGSLPINPALILLGSIFAFVYPIASIGFETADPKIMKTEPRTIGEKLFDLREIIIYTCMGAIAAIPCFIVYLINRNFAPETAFFISVVLTLIYFMLTTRSAEPFYKRITHNRFMAIASTTSILILLLLTLTPVGLIFGMNVANLKVILTSVLIPLITPIIIEGLKIFMKHKG